MNHLDRVKRGWESDAAGGAAVGLNRVHNQKWDVVVIGSGIGGLTVAALLASQQRRRVLVLEKHLKIGGCTHSFQRKKDYQFDVGVHFVGSVSENSVLRMVLARLTQNRLAWKPLPRRLDHVHLPSGDYEVSFDWNDMLKDLGALFPAERPALARFFRRAKRVSDAFVRWQTLELLPAWRQRLWRWWLRLTVPEMFRTTASVMADFFRDEKLKLLLASRWQALGLPLTACSFGYFAGDLAHFSDGGWYPEGGGERIAEELRVTIENAGGAVRTGCRVDQILVNEGRTTGVRCGEEIIQADAVVSGTGAWSTYHRFLQKQDSPYFDRVNAASNLNSYVMVFMALDRSPLSLGINAANHWFYAHEDCRPFDAADADLSFITGLWVGSPSLKRESEAHTLEFATLAPSDLFTKWRETRWRRRPEDYEKLKEKIFDFMMKIAEERFPGLRDAVIHYEVSTPLTVEHFVTQASGGLGIPATPERLHLPWARSRTPIDGLYLTGSDVFAWGISGALAGGLKTYRLMTGSRELEGPA